MDFEQNNDFKTDKSIQNIITIHLHTVNYHQMETHRMENLWKQLLCDIPVSILWWSTLLCIMHISLN